MEKPKQIHWEAIYPILRYLKGTISMGVLYKKVKTLTLLVTLMQTRQVFVVIKDLLLGIARLLEEIS